MTLSRRLRRAAQAGDIGELYAIILKDPYILERIDKIPFADTPLHVAVVEGRDDFAMEIMNLKPSFARKLNKDGYSPIHLALRNEEDGYSPIHLALRNEEIVALQNEKAVLRLLAADKDLVRVKGREGCTPLHYVAEKGNLRLLAQFLVDCPECIQDVTMRNETTLHVAAKKKQLEALEILTQSLRRTYFYNSSLEKKLLNWKDKDGNTVLHLAASENLRQMVELLVECKVNINEINLRGKTALDILKESSIPEQERITAMNILLNAEGLEASFVQKGQTLQELLRSKITFLERAIGEVFYDITNMSPERSSAVLVILVLILTSTYQATLSPPAGLLQSDGHDCDCKKTNSTKSDDGKSALNSASFLLFYVPNTIAFIVTMILTLALLAIVASGITSLLLVPLLLLYFCLLASTFDISPTPAVLVFGILPLISLPIMVRVIGHTKGLKKYMTEKA